MLPKFNPLFILRYSATHKTLRNLVYKLDAIDAFDQKLVKKIEPICIDVTNRAGNTPYVYLSEVRPAKDEPEAIVEIQRQKRDGSIDMETRVVRKGDDLYVMSGKLAAYAKGYTVVELNAKDGYGKVVFENGKELVPGKALGNVDETFDSNIFAADKIAPELMVPIKYLYFVAETKGSLSGMELRKIEQAKISYAEKHFRALSGADFRYHVVTSYDDLLKECVG